MVCFAHTLSRMVGLGWRDSSGWGGWLAAHGADQANPARSRKGPVRYVWDRSGVFAWLWQCRRPAVCRLIKTIGSIGHRTCGWPHRNRRRTGSYSAPKTRDHEAGYNRLHGRGADRCLQFLALAPLPLVSYPGCPYNAVAPFVVWGWGLTHPRPLWNTGTRWAPKRKAGRMDEPLIRKIERSGSASDSNGLPKSSQRVITTLLKWTYLVWLQ